MDILLVFSGIVIGFALLLVFKKITSLRFCVACVSIAGAWVLLLVLYWFGIFDNLILLALLMGQSIVGVYYLLEKRLPQRYQVFRMPFLLSATFVAYTTLAGLEFPALWLLVSLWIASGLLYFYRHHPKLKSTVDHLLACCRDW